MSDTPIIDLGNDSESEDVIMIEDQPETSAPKEAGTPSTMDTSETVEVASEQDSDEVEFVPVDVNM